MSVFGWYQGLVYINECGLVHNKGFFILMSVRGYIHQEELIMTTVVFDCNRLHIFDKFILVSCLVHTKG